MIGDRCSSCGRPLDLHNRHVRFTLPDPVLDTAEKEEAPGVWMSHANPRESVLMQVPNVGAFVRALLPVRLTDGHSITFGVWLAVDPAQMPFIFSTWWGPNYQDLQVKGWLANAVAPWGLLAAPIEAIVRDPEETPYCDRSDDPTLDRVLHHEWPHDLVFGVCKPA